MFVPDANFRRSIRLKQTDRKFWTIQTYSEELVELSRNGLTKFNSSHEKFDVWPEPRNQNSNP